MLTSKGGAEAVPSYLDGQVQALSTSLGTKGQDSWLAVEYEMG